MWASIVEYDFPFNFWLPSSFPSYAKWSVTLVQHYKNHMSCQSISTISAFSYMNHLIVCSLTFLSQAIATVTPEIQADRLNLYCKYLCFLSFRSSKIAMSSLVWTSYYSKVCEVWLSSCCCFLKHLY